MPTPKMSDSGAKLGSDVVNQRCRVNGQVQLVTEIRIRGARAAEK